MTNFGWITISASHFTNETDRRALFTIRDSIPGDPFHVFSSWNRSIAFCDWQGVTCGRRHQRVTMLNLSSLQLVGSMSPHIGNLTFLRTIDLSNNSFRGVIPREVGRLVRLRYLLLSVNSFHDVFPTNSSSLSGIKVIDVIGNNLGGRIPEELGSLSTLSRLLLAKNHFVGTIPPSLGNLSALRVLSLMENNLGGSIPSQLGQLSKLGSLMLSSINVSGTVPASLYNISSLEELSISANRLHGRLPAGLGSTLPNLQNFYVGLNQFDGPIPSSLANASGLVNIDIDTNVFIGPIPLNLGTLRDIEYLNFVDNLLGQSYESNNLKNFIDCLSNSSNLKFLDLGYNHWNSVLPHSIANLSIKLTTLGLVGNYYLSGNIPPGIGYLENLLGLSLNNNKLTGLLSSKVGNLKNLRSLAVSENELFGEIPAALGSCQILEFLFMKGNFFSGTIPESFEQLKGIQLLDVSGNDLSGYTTIFYDCLHFLWFFHDVAEYGMGAEVSRGGDMNSYGVLLLEMFTGKRPTDNMFSDNICLRSYAKMSLPSEVMNIVDPRLIVEEDEEPSRTNQNSTRNTAKVEVCLASVLQIGVSCSAELSGERMNARQQEMFLRNCTRLEICLWRTCNFFFLRSY
ncbi:hypothetical protein RHGRI_031113 [Rhododendron griersonianum]|uniref:Leucine-rich repeat-containing N-terminal plant-type domain-containing protein n=1 Tax=Rhododendron griersonianum TaxID=479676 RepID=A0AAV6ICJ3_9ERIC|nr:hypothetical protein RHGRI_031113 [Rhododendron griersonianum]